MIARNRSHRRVNHEIAQLKAQVAKVNETNQQLQQLQRRNSIEASRMELLAFRRESWTTYCDLKSTLHVGDLL